MATTTFSGPVRVGNASAAAVLLATTTLSLAPTAAANTDLTLQMPAGIAGVIRITSFTTTAYTGNTVTVQVGTTSGGVDVVAAASIKAAGTVAHTLVAAGLGVDLALPSSSILYVRIVQTATVTAVGAGTMVVEFIPGAP